MGMGPVKTCKIYVQRLSFGVPAQPQPGVTMEQKAS